MMICSWQLVSLQSILQIIIDLLFSIHSSVAVMNDANHIPFAHFATAEALAAQVKQENYDKGLIYPPFTNIRKISAHIAANVAAKVYELGECFLDDQLKLLIS